MLPLIGRRTGRTGQIVNLVQMFVNGKRLTNVMVDKLKIRIIQKTADVGKSAGVIVVDTNDAMPVVNQPAAEIRPEKTGPAGNKYCFHKMPLNLPTELSPNRACPQTASGRIRVQTLPNLFLKKPSTLNKRRHSRSFILHPLVEEKASLYIRGTF